MNTAVRYAFSIALPLIFAGSALSQTPVATPEIGANPYKSYAGGEIDHIQMQNGSLYLRIPLVSYPQLGKLKLSFSLVGNSPQFEAATTCDPTGDCSYSIVYADPGIGACLPPDYATSMNGSHNIGIVMDQDIDFGGCTIVGPSELPSSYDWAYGDHWTIYQIEDSSGAVHQMGFNQSNLTTLMAADGSGYAVQMPWPSSVDGAGVGSGAPTCSSTAIYDGSGLKYSGGSASNYPSDSCNLLPTTISDPAGNTIARVHNQTTGTNSIIDSVGRSIPDPTISTAGAGSGLTRDADTSACPNLGISGEPAQASYSWTVPGYEGKSVVYHFCYTTVEINTNFFGNGPGQTYQTCPSTYTDESGNSYCVYLTYEDMSSSEQVLQSVVLPNNTYWGFGYEPGTSSGQSSYGDLLKITLPSGGSLSYNYQTITICGAWANGTVAPAARAVAGRTAIPLVGSPITSAYSYLDNSLFATIETGGYNNDTVHGFTFDNSGTGGCGAHETTTKWYQGSSNEGTSGTVIREVDTSYSYTGLSPQDVYNYYSNSQQHLNMLPQTRKSYLNGQLQSSVTYGYDTLFVASQAYASGSGGGVFNVTSPILYSQPTYINDGIKQTTTTRLGAVNSAYAAVGFVALPSSVVEADGSGSEKAQTVYGYDEAGNPQGTFGNLTSVTKDYGVKTTTQFNTLAMPTQTTDPDGNAGAPNHTTYYSYDSTGLYVTKVQAPTTNGVAHVRYYRQDANTGWTTASSDENASSISDAAHTAYYDYDLVGRLSQVNYPDGGQITKCYTDEGGATCGLGSAPFSVIAQRKQTASVTENSSAEYDGLGRPVQTVAAVGAIVDTTYDLNGHVASVSNAHYGAGSSTDGVTSYLYDPLGRKTFQCQPDNAPLNATTCSPSNSYLSWTYSGNITSFRDENGNTWQRTNDAHNRLVRVVEPGSLTTTYSYDPLDNLLGVSQLGDGSADTPRKRNFTYDALSRLVCASNPENSSASCPSTPGSYTPGTTGYSYDMNGNVLSKTDARGSSIQYSYDVINRLLGKTYSDITLSSCYQYDTVATGLLSAEWTQAGPCPTSAPSSGYQSLRKIGAYDAMGRVVSEQQCVLGYCTSATPPPAPPSNCQSLTSGNGLVYCYDLAGDPTAYSNGLMADAFPQQYMSFSQGFDNAARLSSLVNNSWTGATFPSNLFTLSGTDGYTPFNALQNWTLGSGNISVSKSYDNRLRVTGETAIQQ